MVKFCQNKRNGHASRSRKRYGRHRTSVPPPRAEGKYRVARNAQFDGDLNVAPAPPKPDHPILARKGASLPVTLAPVLRRSING